MSESELEQLKTENQALLERCSGYVTESLYLKARIDELENVPDWVKVGDNTLHGAIDHWQDRCLEIERQNAELEALAIKYARLADGFESHSHDDKNYSKCVIDLGRIRHDIKG